MIKRDKYLIILIGTLIVLIVLFSILDYEYLNGLAVEISGIVLTLVIVDYMLSKNTKQNNSSLINHGLIELLNVSNYLVSEYYPKPHQLRVVKYKFSNVDHITHEIKYNQGTFDNESIEAKEIIYGRLQENVGDNLNSANTKIKEYLKTKYNENESLIKSLNQGLILVDKLQDNEMKESISELAIQLRKFQNLKTYTGGIDKLHLFVEDEVFQLLKSSVRLKRSIIERAKNKKVILEI